MLWPYWCHQIPNHSLQPKKVPAIDAPHLTSRIFHPRLPKTRHLLGEKFHALLSLYYVHQESFFHSPLELKSWMRSNHSVYEMVDLVWPCVTGLVMSQSDANLQAKNMIQLIQCWYRLTKSMISLIKPIPTKIRVFNETGVFAEVIPNQKLCGSRHGTATSRTQSWRNFSTNSTEKTPSSVSSVKRKDEFDAFALRSRCVVFQVVHKHKTIEETRLSTSKLWWESPKSKPPNRISAELLCPLRLKREVKASMRHVYKKSLVVVSAEALENTTQFLELSLSQLCVTPITLVWPVWILWMEVTLRKRAHLGRHLLHLGPGNTRYPFFHANIPTNLGFRTISAHKVVHLLGTEPRVGGQGAIEGAPEDDLWDV